MTNTKHDEANWFSQGGQKYSQYRPEYPPELARFLAEISPRTHKALDVGCGTGQLTRTLSAYFASVTGIDPSEDQLKMSPRSPELLTSILLLRACPVTCVIMI